MKKILFILMVVLMVATLNAAPLQEAAQSRRAEMIERYLKQRLMTADATAALISASKNGEVEAITSWAGKATQGAALLGTDKFGNNVFHVAKDASTVQALAAAVRTLYKNDYASKIAQLKNHRNKVGETPLMMHIGYGRTDTFYLFYNGSELETAVKNAQAVDKGGLLSDVAQIRKGEVHRLAQDNSGRNFCQAARDGLAYYSNLQEVVAFCAQETPYL